MGGAVEGRRYLGESGYPPELYDYQHQLKKPELTEGLDLERFRWLYSDRIEELSVKALPSSNSITGLGSLSRRHSLKKLTLSLSWKIRRPTDRTSPPNLNCNPIHRMKPHLNGSTSRGTNILANGSLSMATDYLRMALT
ncbi:MAG TPA: hypothetical protein VJ810_11735 [Blastocatellia bacterium]|nr:hypothetical protein [Blastocatellia bacterium]